MRRLVTGRRRTFLVVSMRLTFIYLAIALAAGNNVWVDPSSHLTWTTTDNHSGISWRQAARHCRELRLENRSHWRLPTIEELQAIYQQQEGGVAPFHVRGPIQMSGWQWSSTPGEREGESWAFDFGDGGRASVAHGDSGMNRAVCVREDWKKQ